MKFYYSGKKPDSLGVFKVHSENCTELPNVLARVYLGIFPNGELARSSAREKLQISKVRVCKCCIE